MNSTEKRFSKNLIQIIYPTKEQEEKELWNVSGILNKYSNQHLKFDVRPGFEMPDGQIGKRSTILSKADKIVFETDKDWVIIDVVELHDYVKKQSSNIIQFNDLLKKLEWNLYISKV